MAGISVKKLFQIFEKRKNKASKRSVAEILSDRNIELGIIDKEEKGNERVEDSKR